MPDVETPLSRSYPACRDTDTIERLRTTIEHLRLLRERRARIEVVLGVDLKMRAARAAIGCPTVHLKTDPAWLVDMAINRRAGWLDDPWTFGTTQPTWPLRIKDGIVRTVRAADGDRQRHLCQLAYRINTPRLRVYRSELGELTSYLTKRLPHRFTVRGED